MHPSTASAAKFANAPLRTVKPPFEASSADFPALSILLSNLSAALSSSCILVLLSFKSPDNVLISFAKFLASDEFLPYCSTAFLYASFVSSTAFCWSSIVSDNLLVLLLALSSAFCKFCNCVL